MLSVKIVGHSDDENTEWYRPYIVYSYTIFGKPIQADNYSYRDVSSTNYAVALKHIEGIKIGDVIDIFIDPFNHKRSVIKPGFNKFSFIDAILVFLFTASVIGACIYFTK